MAATQALRSTSRGAPGDNQLATYLVDADLFLTNDKIFADLVGEMRIHSPVKLAEVQRTVTSCRVVYGSR
jgi:hypothetical protein